MTLSLFRPRPWLLLAGSLLVLQACGSSFETDYAASAPSNARRDWRPRIEVVVPQSLTVSEANLFIPHADIVWHGDPAGDRRAQVGQIVEEGLAKGFAGVSGGHPVRVLATVQRFHAITPKAYYYAPQGSGVHAVEFTLTVTDARSGEVLAGPEAFHADLPATMATDATSRAAGLPGDVWRAEIERHLAATIRSWLGTGPDVRGHFERLGG